MFQCNYMEWTENQYYDYNGTPSEDGFKYLPEEAHVTHNIYIGAWELVHMTRDCTVKEGPDDDCLTKEVTEAISEYR